MALATFKRRPSLLAESFHDTLTSILFSGQNGIQPQIIALVQFESIGGQDDGFQQFGGGFGRYQSKSIAH